MTQLTLEERAEVLRVFPFSRSALLNGLDPHKNRIFRAFMVSPEATPFYKYGVRMVAYVAFGEFPQIKYLAALGTLIGAEFEKQLEGKTVLVIPTSGNFGIACAAAAPGFGIETAVVVIKIDTVQQKVALMTVAPTAEIRMVQAGKKFPTVLQRAEQEASWRGSDALLLDQFRGTFAEWNRTSHYVWTAPSLFNASPVVPKAVSAFGGTCATARALKDFCNAQGYDTECVLTAVAPGEELPGGRGWNEIQRDGGTLELNDLLVQGRDRPIEVGRLEALDAMLSLSKDIPVSPGATSAGAYCAMRKYLELRFENGTAEQMRGSDGLIPVGFVCPDSSSSHVERVTASVNFSAR